MKTSDKRRITVLLIALLLTAVCLFGCGEDQTENGSGQAENGIAAGTDTPGKTAEVKVAAPAVTMDDIAWEVGEGIIDGERYLMLDYANCSDKTLVSLEITFSEKDSLTEEEKTAYFEDIKTIVDYDENDENDVRDLETLMEREISINAESEILALPGETVSNVRCRYYSGSYSVRNAAHFDLVEPDMAQYRYIDDGVIVTVSYDFVSGKYTKDSKTETAYYWTDSGLEDVIPRPEAEYVSCDGTDDAERFSFDVYGWSLEQFDAYVRQCKERGFTIDPGEYTGFYSAYSASGYYIYFYYKEDNRNMSGWVEAEDVPDAE